jgi:hypothetical protein
MYVHRGINILKLSNEILGVGGGIGVVGGSSEQSEDIYIVELVLREGYLSFFKNRRNLACVPSSDVLVRPTSFFAFSNARRVHLLF